MTEMQPEENWTASGILNASLSTNNRAKIWGLTMCQSLTGIRHLHVLFHFILSTTLPDKHFHGLYLKTEEKKHTEVRKKSPKITQAEFKLKIWHQKSVNLIQS